jgi:hypothetical protein
VIGEDTLSPAEELLATELGGLVAGPPPEARARLMAAVRATPLERSTPKRPRLLRRLAIAAGALFVLLGAGAGSMAASAGALPGTPFYQLRLAGEHVRLTFAGGADKARLRIDFARDRVRQAAALGAHGDRGVQQQLLSDGEGYLHDARANLGDVGTSQRGEVQSQLQQVEEQDRGTRTEVEQQGPSEQNGGSGGARGGSGAPFASPNGGRGSGPSSAGAPSQVEQGTPGPSGTGESSQSGAQTTSP